MTSRGPNVGRWASGSGIFRLDRRRNGEPVRPGRISPRRTVPPEIPRPDYAVTGRPVRLTEPPVRTLAEIEAMRRACRVAAEVMEAVGSTVAAGVTTDELDAVCHAECIRRGAYPSPLNYRGFPKSLCTSVNEVICHGIPDDRPLANGDIVNLDVTVFVGGVHGDLNATYPVGAVDDTTARLIGRTRECLDAGVAAVKPGRPLREIGRAIERHAASFGYGVVRSFVGHGIGTVMHNGLDVPHYDEPSATTIMEPGMTFTIEPMITLGTWRARIWPDGWTAVTADGRRTAQFEHTILVTDDGAEVLTVTGGAAG